jgi:uncharacterized protein (TIGR00303 family)
VVAAQHLPTYLFNAGLPQPPALPAIELGGTAARCLSSGCALPLDTVKTLLEQGLQWGEKLAEEVGNGYVILAECVVGGTTTALAILTGLGIAAAGKVNSSHPTCNHGQKWDLVCRGLERAGLERRQAGEAIGRVPTAIRTPTSGRNNPLQDWPLTLVAAVGDPMQVVVAGMAIAASRNAGVLLAGGTQMLAVYALAQAIADSYALPWQPAHIVVGTTRWVAEDPTGDTVGLAQLVGTVPLMATQLSFADSRLSPLRAYEQGFVKEGVGAGGCAIAAHLYQGWGQETLLAAIEDLGDRQMALNPLRSS